MLKGEQRHCCMECGFNFTQLTDLNKIHPDTKPPETKRLTHIEPI